ncbi:MAG: organomercurial lyase [Candidatus Dormibacteraeota bacterium]|nr:organomercurial lyase [Candidatus Dormibacteraeota bacterium]
MPQASQVCADSWLSLANQSHELTDGALAGCECLDDPEAGWIPEDSEEAGGSSRVSRRNHYGIHIRLAGYHRQPANACRSKELPIAIDISVEQLADAIGAATIEVNDQERRIAVSLWNLLAEGDPVTPAGLTAGSAVAETIVNDALDRWPGIFRDEEGHVVGFWGLAIPPMSHRFQAEGGKPIHAWCALDPFLIVPVIGRTARVESKDPVTGEPISMTVTPNGISDVSPTSVVVSFLVPDKPFDQQVLQSFCNFVHFFASRESAERWAKGRNGIALLSVDDAFEVGRRASRIFGEPIP